MEIHMVESEIIPERVDVHFSDALRIVSGFGKLTGHGVFVVPGQAVLVAYASVVALLHAGVQGGPRRDAAGACAVCVGEDHAFRRQAVKIGRFDIRVSGVAQTVRAKLICHDKYDVWFLHVIVLLSFL